MQDVHITLRHWDQLQARVASFEEHFATQPEEVTVLDWGTSCKLEQGYIVVEWSDEADEAFLAQLKTDEEVMDYSVYTVPPTGNFQFGIELMVPEEPR